MSAASAGLLRRRTIGVCCCIALIALAAGGPASAAPAAGAQVERTQGTTVVLTRDVYVVEGTVLVNPSETTAPSEPLFNLAGTPLGVNWAEYSSATASPKLVTFPDRTRVIETLGHLVPHAVYSLFYLTFSPDSENPACPGVERLLPVADFIADSKGRASVRGVVPVRLLDAAEMQLVVVWHYDGHTYGDVPNRQEDITRGTDCRSSFGLDAGRVLSSVFTAD